MLSGVRVLDLCDERGQLAGKILGDLGADVIKIEPPSGDPLRGLGPFLGGVSDRERSLPWLALNTSKRGVTLDLAKPLGRSIFSRLVGSADAVLDSLGPDTLTKWGTGWKILHAENPGLVYCSITPFGCDGPRAHWRAHDLVVVAMGGNAAMTGDPDRAPLRCSLPSSYYHAAPEAALGLVMALHAQADTGQGQHVDVSMQECQVATLLSTPAQSALSGRRARRSGPRLGETREIWRAADGFVSFGLRGGPARARSLEAAVAYLHEAGMAPVWLREIDWRRFAPVRCSEAERDRIEGAFADFFRTRTIAELYEEALARRILLAPCNEPEAVLRHAQLRARGLFVELEVGGAGECLELPGFFARSEDRAVRIRSRAPRLGEHNAEIYGALGASPEEQAFWRAEGVL